MSGPTPVTFGSLTGVDVTPRRFTSRPHHRLQHQQDFLGHDTGYEEDTLDDEEEVEEMTADSGGGHRGAGSAQDCSVRKSNKPQMEKKRRQRINRSLSDLKALLLEVTKKDPSRYSRLEKADILEMTVRHVQALHRHETRGGGGGEEAKYRAGFTHCVTEVTKFLAGHNDLPRDLIPKLTAYLNAVATSKTTSVNNNNNNVQNSINVTTSPMPIILVLNTGQPATMQGGNSLGVQPLTVVTTTRGPTLLPQLHTNDFTMVVSPPGGSTHLTTKAPPSPSLQASAPVLSSILTSEPGRSTMGRVVQPPALSCCSVDSALGPDTPYMSDSDMSFSGPSTPLSSLSSAGSPSPSEESTSTSRNSAPHHSSPSHSGQPWSSTIFREELCHPRPGLRRPQVIAPKPPHTSRKSRSPEPAPIDQQNMWRPWH